MQEVCFQASLEHFPSDPYALIIQQNTSALLNIT
jgi:hypothetical protein